MPLIKKEETEGMLRTGGIPFPRDEAMLRHILDVRSPTKDHGKGGASQRLRINAHTLMRRMKKLGIPLNRMDRS